MAFLSGGTIIFRGYHRTAIPVGDGGMPIVVYAEDKLEHLPGARGHV